ncbi:DUF1707 SHOCT-like domain-containing protein [Corynebacterium lubricantis]|uniref:DUF1707 SHOCT-like domain-containing protein n=1 Tax=Corynebacterium lubricantis TaxID=541095 RepID=UPI001FE1FFCE|nr:DUF1707 domain-containing protein [Corynebacterium lubricantis]
MSRPFRPSNPNMRLSDNERADAMSALGRALAEGRLSMVEYDDRLTEVMKADTRGDLVPLFKDIPQTPAAGNSTEVAMYSANEVAETHKRGQKTRAGVMGLSTVGSFAAMFIGLAAGLGGVSAIALLIIPTVFILLYVMKVGPDSWYVPSPRQLERQRFREIQSAQALETAQRKAERKEQIEQITGDAMGIAQRALDKFKDSGTDKSK